MLIHTSQTLLIFVILFNLKTVALFFALLNIALRSKSAFSPLFVRSNPFSYFCGWFRATRLQAAQGSIPGLLKPLEGVGAPQGLSFTNSFITMAKGSYLLRGKVGNTVKYRIANSNNKEEQGTRAYQAVVSNPQTTAQATQRMKLAAAVPFYRALAGILDHSFQGVKYGGRSHAKFTQLALKMTTGIPFVERGNVNPVPGQYIVSTGSLMPITLESANADGFEMPCRLTENADQSGVQEGTITLGRLSELIIAQNPDVKDGDQLTFILCGAQLGSFNEMTAETLFSYSYARLVLDTTDTTTLAEWQNANGIRFANGSDTSSMTFDFKGNVLLACAAAVIVSRVPATASGAWQRSTTKLTLASKVSDVFMSEGNFAAVLPSYKTKSTTPSSSWYLNGGTADSTPASGGDSGGDGGGEDEEDRP